MGKICLALVSKRNHPKKYQVSIYFFIADNFLLTGLYGFKKKPPKKVSSK